MTECAWCERQMTFGHVFKITIVEHDHGDCEYYDICSVECLRKWAE